MEDGKVMIKLNVLYEDNHIIVVEKPSGMLSQADQTGDLDLLSLVKSYIKEKYQKPGNVYLGLVHRLDRPVGGIMVFARTSKAASRLSTQIAEHRFVKKYYAVVWGEVVPSKGKFLDYLERLEDGTTIVSEHGKQAILNYEVLQVNHRKNHSLVRISLQTGRHHQIRVQFASRGYPLCGDQRYGRQDKTPLALFAYQLGFYHPVSKEFLSFELDVPKEGYWTEFTV